MSRILLYTRQGQPIAEIAGTAEVSWSLNKYDRAVIGIPKNSSKLLERNVMVGNLIVIEHQNNIPRWGGVLVPPQWWERDTFYSTAYSAEFMFKRRVTGQEDRYQGTAGVMLTTAIEAMNRREDTRLRPGTIFMGGDVRTDTFRLANYYDVIQKWIYKAKVEIWATPEIEAATQQLIFKTHLAERRGVVSNFTLAEGHNLKAGSGRMLLEQGNPVNALWGFGSGGTWDARPKYYEEYTDSQSTYGLWEDVQGFNDDSLAALTNSVHNTVKKNRWVRRSWSGLAVTNTNGAWGKFDVGDVVNMAMRNYGWTNGKPGFAGQVRVISRSYSEREGVMPVAIEEYRP